MTEKYAVFGNPIAHSKSPDIHRQFAIITGQDISYEKELVALDGFTAAVKKFFAAGGKGLNVTVPFKLEAYALSQKVSKRARQAGAVNTLLVDSTGEISGDNTDGIGMVTDMLENQHWQLAGKNILILGAGGAVRGILGPLLETTPHSVVIANRTEDKAKNLAQAFSRQGNVQAVSFDRIPRHPFDIIINGTSASLAGELPPLPTACADAKTTCYDMMYGSQPTPFLAWAKNRGVTQLADGLGMLVEQAAEAFRLWRGIKPETRAVIASLRQSI